MKPAMVAVSIIVLSVSMLPTLQAAETSPLLAAPRSFVDAFNGHRSDIPARTFTDDCAIVDEFPPYFWAGSGSAREWYARLMGKTEAERKKRLAAQERLELGPPRFARINGDFAYLVLPGVLTYSVGGKRHRQEGQWVLTEVRRGSSWIIAAHAWAIVTDVVQ